MSNIDSLKNKLCIRIPFVHVYGEGREIRQDSLPGVVYVNDKNQPCAVNNNLEGVIFWTKNGAEKAGDPSFGNRSAKRKVVNYTLAASSKRDISATILDIINGLEYFDWSNESFDQTAIGSEFFGLSQVNLDTYFYTIEFSVIENVDCKGC